MCRGKILGYHQPIGLLSFQLVYPNSIEDHPFLDHVPRSS